MVMAMAESRATAFYALETYLYPHAVLLKEGATRLVRQFASGSGKGQHTVTISNVCLLDKSESRRPIKGTGSGHSAYVLMSVRRRKRGIMAAHGGQARPS
jgi:hypothetical protein